VDIRIVKRERTAVTSQSRQDAPERSLAPRWLECRRLDFRSRKIDVPAETTLEHKKQHTIPRCYQSAWCDPVTPLGHTPSVWKFPKNDRSKPFRRSPEKSFVSSDRYTIHLPNGARDLAVEKALGLLESDFVGVLKRIRSRENLLGKHRETLAFFTAAMMARTEGYAGPTRELIRGSQAQAVRLERLRSVQPELSLELEGQLTNLVPHVTRQLILMVVPSLLRMNLTVFVADDEAGFITSDEPCVQCIPGSRDHPFIGRPDVEVILPLSPLHLALFTWPPRRSLYADAGADWVNQANSRVFFACHEEFISWKGLLRDEWFDLPGSGSG
jgi:Protein of unknown function (DUF4238)